MVTDVLQFKIDYCDSLIEDEIRAQTRLEVLVLNEQIAVKELPENGAKDKAHEELTAMLSRYTNEIGEREKSIEILTLKKEEYTKQKKKTS